MKHHGSKRKLGREKGPREALIKSLGLALVKHGRIQTTEAKAKELRPWIEKLVTKARSGKLASERAVMSALGNNPLAMKLIKEVGPKMEERPGGYTRIIKVTGRRADAAPEAIIEFVA